MYRIFRSPSWTEITFSDFTVPRKKTIVELLDIRYTVPEVIALFYNAKILN